MNTDPLTAALERERKLRDALEKVSSYATEKSSLSYEGWLSGVEKIATEALEENALAARDAE